MKGLKLIRTAFLILLLLGLASTAHAESWSLAIKGGPGFMLNSKSTTIPHLFKPVLRVEASRGLMDGTSVGIELCSIASTNENYRLIKVSALLSADLYRGSLYALWIRGGFGVGNSPAIMSPDLHQSSDFGVHVDLGTGMSWKLPFANSSLGLEIISDNLATASLLSSLRFDL
jgi:hypothetical protein